MPFDDDRPGGDGGSRSDCCDLVNCTLDKIARVAHETANEVHRNGRTLTQIEESVSALLALYRVVHPDQAMQLDRLGELEARIAACCPSKAPPDDGPYHYEPCRADGGEGSGWSVKTRAQVEPEQTERRPARWVIEPHTLNDSDEVLPPVRQGPVVGQLTPSPETPQPMDFRDGSGPVPGGAQQPVTFRTFTSGTASEAIWPPDMSGAKSGDVVVMSGNLWLRLSVDGGKTFTDLDFTKIFTQETTYGGWAGDQVVHYVPEIDCFVLYVQSTKGSGTNANKNVVKIAIASPADLKTFKGQREAWKRQWHFTSDTFGINAWLDFPDLSYGAGYLYVNTNSFAATAASTKAGDPDPFAGKLFFELPLGQMKAGGRLSFYFGYLTEALRYGSPTQNIGDENYWAAHINNGKIRIYSSKGTEQNYSWRDRSLLANWPLTPDNSAGKPDIVSKPPDATDWISEDNRIIGATKVNNQLWFAWTAAAGTGTGGGFNFPQAHIQIAKVDLGQDYKVVDQTQVWNSAYAFAYPSLCTNSNNEVGISCGWGGGASYGSHVVGILGDFVLWYGEPSDRTSTAATPTRFGDYLHVRLAHPDTRFFSGFGYAVKNDTPAGERADYLYVEFGREAIPSSALH
ncbi:hypothetical protein ASC64_06425 [Nocardioides sp. Root122]|uniref:hypothetical protein n=1 Tax=Nocardioides TaxID=1839 RepID=UPI000702F6D7|nr:MULTISPECIES: hypothetical protein [Nocardioides]KQV69479.1 hypothetical protein ASC64_06425 [Nocardioides sp. Root122]MCK9824255.1 hypothetical protein [Nocardioides cavernae]